MLAGRFEYILTYIFMPKRHFSENEFFQGLMGNYFSKSVVLTTYKPIFLAHKPVTLLIAFLGVETNFFQKTDIVAGS